MEYVVCYSGGHSSALAAIETVRRYGKENVILLNHDISPKVEAEDIKQYKQDIADYLGVPITYANHPNWENMTPLQVAEERGLFQVAAGQKLCTYELKTKPFKQWLKRNCAKNKADWCFIYGFNADEKERMERRRRIMLSMGYKTEFPLAEWERTIHDTAEIGISKPTTYSVFKHGNCKGCLKAGKQHWYVIYCQYPDIFAEAVRVETKLNRTIINGTFLTELIPVYEDMKNRGVPQTDIICSSYFQKLNRLALEGENSFKFEEDELAFED